MEKKIDTLVEDIYDVVKEGAEADNETVDAFGRHMADILRTRLGTREEKNYLRLSNLGTNCDRKLWYSINHPDLGEELEGSTYLKFLLGDVWEAVLLFLARLAGHKVEGEQDSVNLHGVLGHRDAVIDGTIVDVKSASSRSFEKFTKGLTPATDSFGYLTQLDGYLHAAEDDPKVTDQTRAAFFVGDKTLGKLALDFHDKTDKDYSELVKEKQEMLSGDLPERGFTDIPEGASGNHKLGMECSYCPFKKSCWPQLRVFLYKYGSGYRPVYLTRVVKEPKVQEGEL